MESKDCETRSTDNLKREGEAPAEPIAGDGSRFGRSLTLPTPWKRYGRTPTARIAVHKNHAKCVLRSVIDVPPTRKLGPPRVERPSI
jgi:hypothetical protein